MVGGGLVRLDVVRDEGAVALAMKRLIVSLWRRLTPAARVFMYGLCICFVAFLLRLLSMAVESRFLAYVSVTVMIGGLCVCFWAFIFGEGG